ncbi:hypothetical protein T07_3334 [Trichinella nelsoni]|uniref:Uncharacterized protein n=1 Tax=Trichinella nelsoni TaxID=6336 RepID=A0A0V0SF43_9BILA|nr:hypothetical protein T07_3334 [Trichinella nelsoni]
MRNTVTEKSQYHTDCASCAVVVSNVLQSSRTLALCVTVRTICPFAVFLLSIAFNLWNKLPYSLVQEIITLTEPSQWKYVPTADNSADRLSRGCTLGTLLKDHLWWNGSDWLQQPGSEWPRLDVVLTPEEVRATDPERRTTVVLNTTMPAQSCKW